MACKNCNHTMQGLGETADGRRHFWCPRCGTLRSLSPGGWTADGTPSWIYRLCLLVKDGDGPVREADNAQEALNAYVWGCVERRLNCVVPTRR